MTACTPRRATGGAALGRLPKKLILAFAGVVGLLPGQALVTLGPGCGAPPPVLSASGQLTLPSSDFTLHAQATPGAEIDVFASVAATSVAYGSGCHVYLDIDALQHVGVVFAGPTGFATLPVPIPNFPSLVGVQVSWQAFSPQNGGPFLGVGRLSNGVGTTLSLATNFVRRAFSVNKATAISAGDWTVLTQHADVVFGLDGHGYEFPGLIDNYRLAAPSTPVYGFATSMGIQRTSLSDWRFAYLDHDETSFLHCADPASLKAVIIGGQTRLFWVRDDRSSASSSYPNPIGVLSYVIESAPASTGPWTQQGAAIPHSTTSAYYDVAVNLADPTRWYRVRTRLADSTTYTGFSWPTQPDSAATGFAYMKIDSALTFRAGMWGSGPANAGDVVIEWGNLGGFGYPIPASTKTTPANGITEYVGTITSYPSGLWVVRLRAPPLGVTSMRFEPGRRNNRIVSKYGEHLFKPDHPSVLAMHGSRLAALQALGAAGLRLDFAIDSYPSWYVASTPQGNDAAYAAVESHMLAMLNGLRSSYPQMKLWLNGISVTGAWNGILDYVPPADGVDCEFIGWSSPSATAPFREYDMLDGAIAAAHVDGIPVTCLSYAAPTDIPARITSLARYWLVFRPNVFFQYMTQDNHQSVDYFPEYDIDMGLPLQEALTSRNDMVAGSVYRRDFTKGIAFYNPGSSQVTVSFGGPYYVVSATGTWSPKQGGTGNATFSGPVTSTVIAGKRGAIVVAQPGLGR